MILVGTDGGFVALGAEMPSQPSGHAITAVCRADDAIWAISDRSLLWYYPDEGEGQVVAKLDNGQAHCLLATESTVLVGASEARLFRLEGTELVLDDGFMSAEGRDTWHTPWGGPPDVRSMAADMDGAIYLNVHVGGVLRSRDGGLWQPTMDISADVHQVIADPIRPHTAYAASAVGLAITTTGAEAWSFEVTGLHASYCRAVAVGDDYLLVSASEGPGGSKAGVYRRPLNLSAPFQKCSQGLPEWFSTNVDTFCLAAKGRQAVIGSSDGTVYMSDDSGATWMTAAKDVPGIHSVTLA